jgi:hypothetical protein
MVKYRYGKNHEPKPKKPQPPKQVVTVIEETEKPIETRIENGKKIEVYKFRL